jgi:hypothetical protein
VICLASGLAVILSHPVRLGGIAPALVTLPVSRDVVPQFLLAKAPGSRAEVASGAAWLHLAGRVLSASA